MYSCQWDVSLNREMGWCSWLAELLPTGAQISVRTNLTISNLFQYLSQATINFNIWLFTTSTFHRVNSMHLLSYLVGLDRQKMVIIIMFAPPFSTRTMLAGNNIADSGEEECSMAGNHSK